MDILPTYTQVNREDSQVNFGISRMEDIYDRREGRKDQPHRHNFYTILLIKDAEGEHIIDFNTYPLEGLSITFISPGQVHQVIENKRSEGFSLVFSSGFLAQNNIPIEFIEDLNLFQCYGESPPLSLDPDEFMQLSAYAEEMLKLQQAEIALKEQAIGALVKLMLIRANNLCHLSKADPVIQSTGQSTFRNFRELLNQNFSQWHAAAEYASALHITPDHLNRVVKSLSGKTAKEHIQSRILTAARRLLYFTDQSNKEIAYALGFKEPAHFSAFFKKCTGTSPSHFRSGI
ncbi:helix-turn-helix domain-containing protein [Lentiprolixibacter aurantiacus]|uniref:Helix-turn-helix transcriptional regulator n=1 Tax=Lentiprolixibacter aurantiacus TaxID=2993939 RepID=A0AAE3MM78_9FLAO|nr:helix-turn-helix domain-containing protein [Lentiprolixibacter aurantiacus]MCX2720018.1 helix-turn-helix transcriptional regulator [Lentiprolixibacter aurantiacus]